MNETNENTVTEETEDDRPPVDPRNRLYTLISILLFVVFYALYYLINNHLSLTYVIHYENPDISVQPYILREIGMDSLPEGFSLDYARIGKNYDDNTLYICLSVPDSMTSSDFAEEYIPYEYGNVVYDERFRIWRSGDMNPSYVYGDSYVYVEDPDISCLFYDDENGKKALFRTVDYSDNMYGYLSEGEKIKIY